MVAPPDEPIIGLFEEVWCAPPLVALPPLSYLSITASHVSKSFCMRSRDLSSKF